MDRAGKLDVRNVTAAYGSRTILDDISVSFRPNEVTVIMGRSGCGKSTLLKTLSGLLRPKSGEIMADGRNILAMRQSEFDDVLMRWGMLFQNAALLNSLTVGENVALPVREHTHLHDHVVDIMVEMKLSMVGLAGCKDLMPDELSGGMRKRAGLARALVLDPEVLFLDEPVTGLDPVIAAGIDALVLRLKKALRMTMVVVSHDVQSVMRIADRIVMIADGKLLAEGPAEEIRNSPVDEIHRFFAGEASDNEEQFKFSMDNLQLDHGKRRRLKRRSK
jgi:phospholipid/cholesterol/gamma-HCH transport system ATP-binding protein